mmetsp:Transcript_43596/g.120577  ORF Transcript_43596/g.120577 Transcript_43596/m.120577 type:complete len:221 (+) Transcript_43596:377-1039(+)
MRPRPPSPPRAPRSMCAARNSLGPRPSRAHRRPGPMPRRAPSRSRRAASAAVRSLAWARRARWVWASSAHRQHRRPPLRRRLRRLQSPRRRRRWRRTTGRCPRGRRSRCQRRRPTSRTTRRSPRRTARSTPRTSRESPRGPPERTTERRFAEAGGLARCGMLFGTRTAERDSFDLRGQGGGSISCRVRVLAQDPWLRGVCVISSMAMRDVELDGHGESRS